MSVSSKTTKGQALIGIKLLNSPGMVERMKKAQIKNIKADAATDIMEFIEDKLKEKNILS